MRDSSSSPELFKNKKDTDFLKKKRAKDNRKQYEKKKKKKAPNDQETKINRTNATLNQSQMHANTSTNLNNSLESENMENHLVES